MKTAKSNDLAVFL